MPGFSSTARVMPCLAAMRRLGSLRRSARRAVSALALALVFAFAFAFAFGFGCGHADAFEDGVLRKGDLTVRLGPVPAPWRRVSLEGADLAFRDEEHAASAMFDVHCARRDGDAPLAVLTAQLIMGTTQRDFEHQEILALDGREALHTTLRAKLDGVPMQYDIYVMKKDGCVYDVVYVALPGRYAEGAADFERFATGLRAVGPPVLGGSARAGAP